MGWLFYTLLLVCCFSVGGEKAPTWEDFKDLSEKTPTNRELNDVSEKAPTNPKLKDLSQKAATQAELNDLSEKLEKVEAGLDTYPPSNNTDDRLERIEILVNLLLEDVYDVRVDQELLKREILSRLEEIEGKLGDYQPSNQTGWIESMLAAHFKDFRPVEVNTKPQVPKVHRDCRAAYEAGWVRSGKYRISPDGQHEMDVVCEQEEHEGGWVVVQRRLDGTVNFHRTWDEYRDGFGRLDGEFWIGNQNINVLTKNRKQTLRIELKFEGEGFYHVDFTHFSVGNASSQFKLQVSGFIGEDNRTGDSFSSLNNQPFSTKGADNDNNCMSCADVHRSGWWHDDCTESNLNGVYAGQAQSGIFWKSWRGFSNSLISVKMMVRGADEGDTATTSATTRPTTSPIKPTTSKPETTSEPATTEPPTTTEPATTAPPTTTTSADGKDCQEVYANGGTTSGIYTISPGGKDPFQVFCEQTLEGGGWTVFQRRTDGTVEFYRVWKDYKEGFGSAQGEHWIGNDHLHQLTSNQDTQLLVELEYGGETRYARYREFWITGEQANYMLHVTGYTGTAGDSLAYHNGSPFTTRDQDNDDRSFSSCAQEFSGAWWYHSCYHSNLNGRYNDNSTKGVTWRYWKGDSTSLSATRMMVKSK